MEVGMIGLGRMGGNMTQRLINGGHKVTVYDPKEDAVRSLVEKGAVGTFTLTEFTSKLTTPRVVWMMVPSGTTTENMIEALANELSLGDIVVDGGNSNYKESIHRARKLAKKGITMLDVGTSGGIWGLKEGYCLMIGGEREAFEKLEPVFKTLAPAADRGYGYVGLSGAGHFVKMVHNGIEYGLMESYAEGFELLVAKDDFKLEIKQIAELWRYGSVVRSWLLDLIAEALRENPNLEGISAYVEDSGEGRWTAQEAIELGVPLSAITQALTTRFRSRQQQPLASRLLAVMRQKFGGHAVKKQN